jgi:hypothetical protein
VVRSNRTETLRPQQRHRERALLAAEHVFEFLKKGSAKWKDVQSTFEEITYAENLVARIKLIRKIYPQLKTTTKTDG